MTPRRTAPPSTRSRSPGTKLFVLDTNVLMHDPTCLFRFQEHDLYIPMATLEELDANKKGVSEVSRNARQASRFLDEIISPVEHAILLLGTFELKHHIEIPYRVVINEAVELAKTFGGTDGFKYVNGVLDKLAPQLRVTETGESKAGRRS